MTDGALLDAALAWAHTGAAVVPARVDGTKAPAVAWKAYQDAPPDEAQVSCWLGGDDFDGFGVITGTVSGNLEMLEVEGRAAALLNDIAAVSAACGLGELWQRVVNGYAEATPSGGLHVLFRVDGPALPNTKLARDAEGQVLIETRGQGGFSVVAPSGGRTHPSGKSWRRISGSPAQVATLTVAERDALYALLRTFDHTPEPEDGPEPDVATGPSTPGDGPGVADAYNAATTWADLLAPEGWTKVGSFAGVTYWRRPGKGLGVSATTGRNTGDNLYVFSTSTPFDAERPYSRFRAYAQLHHSGDLSAAGRALYQAGYGRRPEPPRLRVVTDDDTPTATAGPATYSRTDDGNALRLVDAHAHELRYVPERARWLSWDGHRWAWDHGSAGVVVEHARRIMRDLPTGNREDDAHQRRSMSTYGIEAAVRLALRDPRITVSITDLDARPYELNTPAGILDLRTATLRPADPDALHTRSTAVAPDFDTQPLRWLAFLARTFAGDPDLITYVQRLLGLSLIGAVLEQLLPFCYGDGANGKSTLLETVQHIAGLGDDGYATSAGSELLLATALQSHPTDMARLAGARLVVSSEIEEGQRFAEARVKQLTGGDIISARFMRADFFSFTPSHTLWLHANHQPSVRAGGPAFWRRLRLIPFNHVVPESDRVKDLQARLVADEGGAILAWLAHGAADYLRDGLPEPASVRAATGAYEAEQDTVARFVADRCVVGDPNRADLRVPTAALRSAYETWCRTEGEAAVSAKALTQALRAKYGVHAERTAHARYYAGIRLDVLEESAPEAAADGRGEDWWQR